MGEWRHREAQQPLAGPDEHVCVQCAQDWPCDAEQQRLRAASLETALRHAIERMDRAGVVAIDPAMVAARSALEASAVPTDARVDNREPVGGHRQAGHEPSGGNGRGNPEPPRPATARLDVERLARAIKARLDIAPTRSSSFYMVDALDYADAIAIEYDRSVPASAVPEPTDLRALSEAASPGPWSVPEQGFGISPAGDESSTRLGADSRYIVALVNWHRARIAATPPGPHSEETR